jgi:hypothetical protein
MTVPKTNPERTMAVFYAHLYEPDESGNTQYDHTNFMSASTRAAKVMLRLVGEGYSLKTLRDISNLVCNTAMYTQYPPIQEHEPGLVPLAS